MLAVQKMILPIVIPLLLKPFVHAFLQWGTQVVERFSVLNLKKAIAFWARKFKYYVYFDLLNFCVHKWLKWKYFWRPILACQKCRNLIYVFVLRFQWQSIDDSFSVHSQVWLYLKPKFFYAFQWVGYQTRIEFWLSIDWDRWCGSCRWWTGRFSIIPYMSVMSHYYIVYKSEKMAKKRKKIFTERALGSRLRQVLTKDKDSWDHVGKRFLMLFCPCEFGADKPLNMGFLLMICRCLLDKGPNNLVIWKSWSISDSPGNNGSPVNISAYKHPMAQISTSLQYSNDTLFNF